MYLVDNLLMSYRLRKRFDFYSFVISGRRGQFATDVLVGHSSEGHSTGVCLCRSGAQQQAGDNHHPFVDAVENRIGSNDHRSTGENLREKRHFLCTFSLMSLLHTVQSKRAFIHTGITVHTMVQE